MKKRNRCKIGVSTKGHPTGKIGRPYEGHRRQLGAVVKGNRVHTYHATKGWLSRRA